METFKAGDHYFTAQYLDFDEENYMYESTLDHFSFFVIGEEISEGKITKKIRDKIETFEQVTAFFIGGIIIIFLSLIYLFYRKIKKR